MDVSAKMLHDVEFRERFRGYDPDEVDDFLERVAKAVEQLQTRLKEANDRADAAEVKAASGADIDESLRRTLLLAQRTADQAIAEAEEQARTRLQQAEDEAAMIAAKANDRGARVLADAEVRALTVSGEADRRAASTVADAEYQAASKLASAQQEAAVRFGSTHERLQKEVVTLDERRAALITDVEALEHFVEIRREGLRRTIDRLQVALDDPDHLRVEELPALAAQPLSDEERGWMTKPLNAGPDVITGPPVAISASEPIQAVAPETAGTEMNGTPGGNGSTANGTSALGAIRSEEAFLAEIKAQSAHNDSSVDSLVDSLPVSSATITPPPNSVPSVIGGSMANGSVNGDGRASLAALVTGLGPSEVTDADVIVDVDAEVDDDGQRRGMFRRRA